MNNIQNKNYLFLYNKFPYMTCSLITLWCIIQLTRKPIFTDYNNDKFCFSSDKPFRTVFMYAFSHSDIAHLTFNSIGMFLMGGLLEAVEGPFIVLFIFANSVTMGACYFALWKPNSLVRGASGGSYGIMTAQLSTLLLNWSEMPLRWLRFIVCITIICIELVAKYVYRDSTIGYAVHFGGALGGFASSIIYVRNVKVRYHELFFMFVGLCLYFGSAFYVLDVGFWKPGTGALITGFPLLLQSLMTIILYDHDNDTQLKNGNNIFDIMSWKKLFRKKNTSILPEHFIYQN